jgi:hypothetical protein
MQLYYKSIKKKNNELLASERTLNKYPYINHQKNQSGISWIKHNPKCTTLFHQTTSPLHHPPKKKHLVLK